VQLPVVVLDHIARYFKQTIKASRRLGDGEGQAEVICLVVFVCTDSITVMFVCVGVNSETTGTGVQEAGQQTDGERTGL